MSLAISLSSNRLTTYHEQNRTAVRPSYSNYFPVHRTQNQPKGRFSNQGQKNLRNAINWLVLCSKKRYIHRSNGTSIKDFQISFVTLTLPSKQLHPHSEIKSKCLNLFLTIMRNKYKLENYVWKAELQKNGAIHFHLTFDKYYHHMMIRKLWNSCIEKLGYVTAYQNKFYHLDYDQYSSIRSGGKPFDPIRMQKAFQYGNRSRWRNPNTTDVKSVKNVESLAGYLSKYMAKPLATKADSSLVQSSAKSYTGRIWYCSTSLSRMKNIKLPMSMENMGIINAMESVKTTFVAYHDYSKSLYFKTKELPEKVRYWLHQELFSHAVNRLYPFPDLIPTM